MRSAAHNFYFIRLILLLVALIFFTNNVRADDEVKKTSESIFDRKEFDENNIVIYQIVLSNGILLSESISGYQENNQLFLSLADFVGALEFPIKLEEDGTKASGWFFDEKRNFSLNLTQRLSVSNGKQYVLGPYSAITHDGEIFVNLELLQQWFPLKISYDSLTQVVQVEASEPLPIELKMDRETRWEQSTQEKELKDKEDKKDIGNQTITTPYRAGTLPLVDMKFGYSRTLPKTGHATSLGQMDTLMSGDLLYLNHQLFTSASNDGGISAARLTSGRKDRDANLLGPLHATEFSMGDVYTPQIPLAARSQAGRGVSVSNYPEGYITDFDNIIIRDNAQPGWDVELYRNDSLLNFLTVPSNGIYEFDKVPLVSGVNIIKLVFYGPYGQKRTEEKKYYMNENLIKKGQFLYRFTANKDNQSLIHIPSKTPSTDPKDGSGRYVAETTYGLTKTTSFAANFLKLPADNTGKETSFGVASVRSSVFGVFGRFDLIRDLTNQFNAAETSLQSRFFDFDFTVKHDRYEKEFVSEEKQFSADPMLNKTSVRVDGSIRIPHLPLIRTSSSLDQQRYNSKNDYYNFIQEFSSTVLGKLNITQHFQHSLNEAVTDNTRVTETGKTFLNYRFSDKLSLRSSLDYNIKPNKELSTSSATLDYNMSSNYNANFTQTHQFTNSNQKSNNTYSLNLNKIFDNFIASLGGTYGDLAGYGVNANLSISFGYDARYKTGNVSGRPIASSGAIAARTFLDNNNNDVYDNGDKLLPNIRFSVDGVNSKNTTNENGAMLVTGVAPISNISLNAESLDDTSWISKRAKTKVISHPGGMLNLEYPVSPTGDIEGTILITTNGLLSPASNVVIELINERGVLVKTATSSFDGYYLIGEVPFDKYKVRVSKSQLERLNLGANTSYKVTINSENASVSGFDFTIGTDITDKTGKEGKTNKPSGPRFKIIKGDPDRNEWEAIEKPRGATEDNGTRIFKKKSKDQINNNQKTIDQTETGKPKTYKIQGQESPKDNDKNTKKKMIFTPLNAPEVKFKIKEGATQVKELEDITPQNTKKDYILKKSATEKTADEINSNGMKKYKIQSLEKEKVKTSDTKKYDTKNIQRKSAESKIDKSKNKSPDKSQKLKKPSPKKEVKKKEIKKKETKKAKEVKKKDVKKSDKKAKKEDKKKKSETLEHSRIIDPSTLN